MSKWEWKKLGEVCEIARGGSPRPIKEYITSDADGINWIKIGDTDPTGKYIFSTEEKIKPSGIKKSRYVESGDFLLSNSMSFGRPYILKTNGCIHDGWLVLKNYQKYLDVNFFYHLLSSPIAQEQFDQEAKGSTVRNLNTDIVSKVYVPIPPLSEQKRIVKFLDEEFSKIDTLKTNAETNLKNAKELFETTLEKELNPLSRHSERSEESSADLPSGWEWKTLQEICGKIVDGTHNSPPNKAKGDYQYITAKNIKADGIDLSDVTYVSKEVHKEIFARCNPEKGDVLLIKDGATTGIAVINTLDYEFSLLSSVALIKVDKTKIYEKTLVYLLNSKAIYKQMRKKMDGAAITRLTLEKIKALQIPLPPLSVQKEIVARLDKLSENVKRLEANYKQIIANCDELKKSILKKTFEGES
ncbi:MAG: restriction endonuclease subunit S [Fibrobacter sp.]|nr:restriction endonuclease subunit S [Fibrobacter sp.]